MEDKSPDESIEDLDTKTVAERTGLNRKTVQKLASAGEFKDARKNDRGQWRIPIASVLEWLASRQVSARPTFRRARRARSFLPRHRLAALTIYIATLASGIGGLVSTMPAIKALAGLATSTEAPEIARQADGETLVLVTGFSPPGGRGPSDASYEIQHGIELAARDNELTSLRVEVASDFVSESDLESAGALGRRYGASVIVWGQESDFRLTINVLSLVDDEIAQRIDQARYTFDRPQDYLKFVTERAESSVSAIPLYVIAMSQVTIGQYANAGRLLDKVIANSNGISEENIADIYYLDGYVRIASYQYTKAVEDYTYCLEADPGDLQSYIGRGAALVHLDRLDEAFDDYERVLSIEPHNIAALDGRSLIYSARGMPAKAIEDETEAISLDPRQSIPFVNRAVAYEAIGQIDLALKDYETAMTNSPENVHAYSNRAGLFERQGQPEKALEDFDTALTIGPDWAEGYYGRAVLKDKLGQPEEALKDYDMSVELAPDWTDAYFARATVRGRLGDLEGSTADYNTILLKDPTYSAALYNRGVNEEAGGNLATALTAFEAAIELQPDNFHYRLAQGSILIRLSRWEDALRTLNVVLSLEPALAEGFYLRGLVNEQLNNSSDALKDMDRAIAISQTMDSAPQFEIDEALSHRERIAANPS